MFENLLGAMMGMTLGLTLGVIVTAGRTHAAVARMETRLNLLLKHSGIDADALAVEQVTELVREGKKIEAIKAFRELTGCGLAQAKQKVEALTNRIAP